MCGSGIASSLEGASTTETTFDRSDSTTSTSHARARMVTSATIQLATTKACAFARSIARGGRVARARRGWEFPRRSSGGMATNASTNDEVLKAQEAHLKGLDDKDERTIFDKIISKEIPATVIYEDELALAFRDIAPQAKTHFLVIPKIRAGLTRLSRATEDHKMLLGHLMYTASVVAKQEKLDAGYRCVINDGVEGCQSVYHLHVHVLGGQQLSWPPGTN